MVTETAIVVPRLTAFLFAGAAYNRGSHQREHGVTELDYETKLEELDRLLNDPDVPMQPGRIWSLLAEIEEYASPAPTRGTRASGPLPRRSGTHGSLQAP